MKGIRKLLLIGLGTLCVALAILGIFLPLLPTTVFLLLAAFFYARSSERFYRWLMTNRLFGTYLKNYREGRGIPLKQKVFTLALLWLSIGYSAFFLVSTGWVKVVLLGIAIGVTLHLIAIKTFKPGPQGSGPVREAQPIEESV